MPRAKLFFSEAFRSIGANLSTTVAATMTVLIGMFLLGLFIALFSWVNSWTDHVRKDVLVKVYFEQQPEATQPQINSVGAKIRDLPRDEDGRVRLEGRGAQADGGEVSRAGQEPRRQPAPERVRGDAEGRRPGLRARGPAEPAAGRGGEGRLRAEEDRAHPLGHERHQVHLPARVGDPPDRLDNPDREHDPPLDLLQADERSR